MAIPAQVLSAGMSAQAVFAICGDGATALVATGTNQATAYQLGYAMNTFTTSSASTGAKLPPCQVGAVIAVRNDSGQTLTFYPFETSGVTINAGASSVTVATAKTVLFIGMSGTTWASLLGA